MNHNFAEWILVEDRLPTESDGLVLVCFPDVHPYNLSQPYVGCSISSRVKIGTYSEYSHKWYIGEMSSVGGTEPIAWMPLPEPIAR